MNRNLAAKAAFLGTEEGFSPELRKLQADLLRTNLVMACHGYYPEHRTELGRAEAIQAFSDTLTGVFNKKGAFPALVVTGGASLHRNDFKSTLAGSVIISDQPFSELALITPRGYGCFYTNKIEIFNPSESSWAKRCGISLPFEVNQHQSKQAWGEVTDRSDDSVTFTYGLDQKERGQVFSLSLNKSAHFYSFPALATISGGVPYSKNILKALGEAVSVTTEGTQVEESHSARSSSYEIRSRINERNDYLCVHTHGDDTNTALLGIQFGSAVPVKNIVELVRNSSISGKEQLLIEGADPTDPGLARGATNFTVDFCSLDALPILDLVDKVRNLRDAP